MHHLCAFASSIAQDAALASIGTLADQLLTQNSSTAYTFARPLKLLRAYVRGNSASRAQYDSPTIRLIGPPEIQPIDTAAAPPNLPPINKYDDAAFTVPPLDPLGVKISRAGVGAATCQALLWVGEQYQGEQKGPCFPVQATGAITASTSAWTAGALTFGQALPTGRYRIIGMSAQGTNLLAARLIFPNQTYRPGVLAQDAAGEYDHEWFRRGAFGVFGEFDSVAPPTLEVLAFGANTSQTIWLDLQPVGPIR